MIIIVVSIFYTINTLIVYKVVLKMVFKKLIIHHPINSARMH